MRLKQISSSEKVIAWMWAQFMERLTRAEQMVHGNQRTMNIITWTIKISIYIQFASQHNFNPYDSSHTHEAQLNCNLFTAGSKTKQETFGLLQVSLLVLSTYKFIPISRQQPSTDQTNCVTGIRVNGEGCLPNGSS